MGKIRAIGELIAVLWAWLRGEGKLLELLLAWLEVVTGACKVDDQVQGERPERQAQGVTALTSDARDTA